MGEAAESEASEAGTIELALAEYEAYCAGRLSFGAAHIETEDGVVQYCGALEDFNYWTVAYVRDEDRSVTPLAVGDLPHVLRAFQRLDARGDEFWNGEHFPPPVAVIGGVPHRFQAAEGRFLLGVVRVGSVGVLLVAVDGALAVVHVEGEATTVLHAGPVRGPIKVDVDVMLRLARPQRRPRHGSPPVRPVRPDRATLAHHVRIVGGRPVEPCGGPPVAVVLRACFDDIGRRAEKLPPRRPGDKLRGITVLGKLLDYLCALAVRGSGDLVGVRRTIVAKLRAHFPDFDLSADALSDAFELLLRVGTCIVGRKKLKWTIRLADLPNPRSALHRQLCKETEHGGGIGEAANSGAEVGACAARKARGAGKGRRAAGAGAGVDADGGEASMGPGTVEGTARCTRGADTGTESAEGAPDSTGSTEAEAATGAVCGEEARHASSTSSPSRASPVSEDRPTARGASAPAADAMATLQGLATQREWMLRVVANAATLAVQKVQADWRAERATWQAEREQLLARLAQTEAAAATGGAATQGEGVSHEASHGEVEEPAAPHEAPNPKPPPVSPEVGSQRLDQGGESGGAVGSRSSPDGEREEVSSGDEPVAVQSQSGADIASEVVEVTLSPGQDQEPTCPATPEPERGLPVATAVERSEETTDAEPRHLASQGGPSAVSAVTHTQVDAVVSQRDQPALPQEPGAPEPDVQLGADASVSTPVGGAPWQTVRPAASRPSLAGLPCDMPPVVVGAQDLETSRGDIHGDSIPAATTARPRTITRGLQLARGPPAPC